MKKIFYFLPLATAALLIGCASTQPTTFTLPPTKPAADYRVITDPNDPMNDPLLRQVIEADRTAANATPEKAGDASAAKSSRGRSGGGGVGGTITITLSPEEIREGAEWRAIERNGVLIVGKIPPPTIITGEEVKPPTPVEMKEKIRSFPAMAEVIIADAEKFLAETDIADNDVVIVNGDIAEKRKRAKALLALFQRCLEEGEYLKEKGGEITYQEYANICR